MGVLRPFFLFGGAGKPATSMAALLGSHMTLDEARAQFENERPKWAEIAVVTDDGLQVIWRWPEPKEDK